VLAYDGECRRRLDAAELEADHEGLNDLERAAHPKNLRFQAREAAAALSAAVSVGSRLSET